MIESVERSMLAQILFMMANLIYYIVRKKKKCVNIQLQFNFDKTILCLIFYIEASYIYNTHLFFCNSSLLSIIQNNFKRCF